MKQQTPAGFSHAGAVLNTEKTLFPAEYEILTQHVAFLEKLVQRGGPQDDEHLKKLYDLLAVRPIKARNLDELAAFDPDRRHIERDKRIRKSPVESGILALT